MREMARSVACTDYTVGGNAADGTGHEGGRVRTPSDGYRGPCRVRHVIGVGPTELESVAWRGGTASVSAEVHGVRAAVRR